MNKNLRRNTLSFFGKRSKDLVFLKTKSLLFSQLSFIFLLFGCIFVSGLSAAYSQSTFQPTYFSGNQQTGNYLSNSSAFKQEIARMEINVARQGKAPIPLTQVPRLQKDDVLKIHLLEEAVNGVKPDQSNWNWTLLVAFINPGRNNDKQESVSEEIQFRKTGWYKEYSFTVPYDSQPIFFLYSKPNYRGKILNLINKNQDEIRKIGEKTIELSGAYAKIGSFLDELQFVVNRNAYGSYGYGGYGSTYGSNYGSTYGNYGSSYGSYGGGYGTTNSGFNSNFFMNQAVERLARSFNIQLPSCWQNSTLGYGGGFSSYGNSTSTPGTYYGVSQDFVGRSQCVAKSVRLEDFDVSVSRMLQQGGILAASQLSIKYPQLAFWINVAAAAIDVINKITKKSALKIVPTVTSSSDNQGLNLGYQTNFAPSGFSPNSTNSDSRPETVKISLYAESPPNDTDFVTAYPLVIQKWQANPDPEIISLPTPILAETCLHAGQNILKSTDLTTDWMSDNFTKNFQLVISSPNGFRKEFPLKKNIGLGGWELNITREDLNAFPKINMTLDSVITGRRGFNEIKSPKFDLPIPNSGNWEVKTESQKAFAVGEKRTVTLRNQLGNCKCLQAVVYKPSFGGQFVFDVNNKENSLQFSEDGKEVSFEVDATFFQPGAGQLELRQAGGEVTNLPLNLYPAPPSITSFRISKGDNQAIIAGVGLEQLRAVKINGKRAIIAGSNVNNPANSQNTFSNANQGVVATNPVYSLTPSEKTVVFEDPNAKQEANVVSLELELDDSRVYQYPKTFSVTVSRPSIVANQAKEVDGIAIGNSKGSNTAVGKGKGNGKIVPESSKTNSQFTLSALPVFPVDSSEILVNVQNALTDYDFKVENIQIETRIEKSEVNPSELPKVDFEVLDWKNMKISFMLNEQSQRLLGGRRLQFRILDKIRGDSDWYTLQKTFARIPQIASVRCTGGAKGNCELKGEGIEYISQVSVDGGKSWFPQEPATLTAQPTPDGRKVVAIPSFSNKKLLQIRLRDYPKGEGLTVNDYILSNTTGRGN